MEDFKKSIDDVLINGTKDEIINLKCECGGKIHYKYSKATCSMRYWCDDCYTLTMLNKIDIPNCYIYFGEEHNG